MRESIPTQEWLKLERDLEEWEKHESFWKKLTRFKTITASTFWLLLAMYLAHLGFQKLNPSRPTANDNLDFTLLVLGVIVALIWLIMDILED
jgi:hypothetical protein